jgi:hypothetical protein
VVRPGLDQHGGKRRAKWRLSAAIVAIATAAMIALPTGGLPASSSVGGPQGPSSRIRPWVENEDYNPAAAYFYSLLSFGAMSVITPAIFGDFQSPVAVSQAPQWSGIMPQGAGFDPAISTMLNGVMQQDILPSAGALIAEEFGVGSNSDAVLDGDAAAPSASGSEFSGGVPTMAEDMRNPTIEPGALEPICTEDEVAGKLQAGGEFWNDPGTGLGGAKLAPAQFPLGVFARPVMLASPLRGLGPNGDRSNLVAPGPAGGWCRPGREPFSLSSPIEDDLLWIALSIVLCAKSGSRTTQASACERLC